MTNLIVAAAVAAVLLFGAFTLGSRSGFMAGRAAGHDEGYKEAAALRDTAHKAAIDRLNREAAEAHLAAVLEEEDRHDRELAEANEARNIGAIELARLAADSDRLTRRVQSLLRQIGATASCNQSGAGAVPGAATDPTGDAAAPAGRLLLDRIGAGLAGLASAADTTLAQYTICERMMRAAQKERRERRPDETDR